VCSYSAPGLPKPTNNLIMRELSTRHPEADPATRDKRLLRFARNDESVWTKKSPLEAGFLMADTKNYFLPLPLAGAAAGAAASGATSSATDTTLTNTGLFLP